MGSGHWSAASFTDRAAARARTGADAFDYSARSIREGRLRPHQTLDPQGLGVRQSRDSEEHPESNSILISLDVTGSMGKVVRGIHQDLPRLHELLLGHNYIAHPQILFGAIGDATCDQVPLQVGQFESDNRMDQNLENMILEGGGGGQMTESYELMLYVAARHTATDCWDKRRRKGYLFMIGDEMAYPAVKASEVNRLIGAELQADLPLGQAISEVEQRWNLYYIIPGGASNGADRNVIGFWNEVLGRDRVIRLDSPEDTSECIAMTIGISEGAIDVGTGIGEMRQRGLVSRTVDRIARALGGLAPGAAAKDHPGRSRRL